MIQFSIVETKLIMRIVMIIVMIRRINKQISILLNYENLIMLIISIIKMLLSIKNSFVFNLFGFNSYY